MSINLGKFSNQFSSEIGEVRNSARNKSISEDGGGKLVTDNGKNYMIKGENVLKQRKGQSVRNALRKFFGMKETLITVTERTASHGTGKADALTGTIKPRETKSETSIRFIHDKGKYLDPDGHRMKDPDGKGIKFESQTPKKNQSISSDQQFQQNLAAQAAQAANRKQDPQ
jgi:hypothetical protein